MNNAVLDRLRPRMQPAKLVRYLTALGMGVAAGMLALGGTIIFDSRADAWHQAEQASNNLVLALTRDIARTITLYDLSIRGARDAIALPDINQVSAETRQMALFDRAATAEYLGALLVLDRNGDIVADSIAIKHSGINLADREHFRIHQEHPDAGLFISRPIRSRLRAGEPSLAISRRINRPDGSFGGVVAGTMRLAYFRELFGKLDLGSAGSVTLLRADGRIIMRLPFRESDLDRDLSDTPLFGRYLTAEAGTVDAKATVDGIHRLYTFRHIQGLPLVLSVAVAVDDIYAAWRSKAVGIGLVLTLLCGTTLIMCVLFRREILRRIEAESELRDAAQRLKVIATTDGLTGVANRRAFDEALTREWKRSIRNQTSIALLMLDADFFKRFNDTYGHPAGDAALRSIAECIIANVRRPADTGARFGGEEFVALLPETELQGAVCVAERIRASVAAKAIPHIGNPAGHVTVSIGVAVVRPPLGGAQAVLVARADEALYYAKHAGRDRVSASNGDAALPASWEPAVPALALPFSDQFVQVRENKA